MSDTTEIAAKWIRDMAASAREHDPDVGIFRDDDLAQFLDHIALNIECGDTDVNLARQNAALQEELAQARAKIDAFSKDSARLDWLQTVDGDFANIDRITSLLTRNGQRFNGLPTLRAAIDAAISEHSKPSK